MSKKMLIDASHPEETRVVVVDGTRVEELDYESANKRQLRGNVYLARVTRVEPSLQAAFVEFGGNRHGFLAFSEIHPDYYQIPHEDRLALLEAEKEETRQAEEDDENERTKRSRKRSNRKKDPELSKDDLDDDDSDEEDASDEEASSDDDDASKDSNDNSEDSSDASPDDDASSDDTSSEEEVTDASDEEVEDEQKKMHGARRKRQSKRRYKIQEVIKRGQILLIQAVKEERGNKGAAMTTYLSLAGRYCVLMPNTPRGGGISRKIANGSDRKRLKSVMSELSVPQGMGVIVRTAGAKRTKVEIKRDYDYLSRLWDTIRKTTLKSIAPSLIHEEGNLVKRSIRDLYGKDVDSILVQGDDAYRVAKDFIKMLMPSHAKNVQPYKDDIPLFLRYQVEQQIENCLAPIAQLKSGGYLVIHPTEALVSVDVNSGRSTKERNVERTALKTNLETADELARQMRLRDLAGLIVVDFIDMDENRNNRAVEKRMRDALSKDRARVQMSKISQFGLMEISRQRRRRSLLEGSTASCEHCHGVGRKRSIESSALKALRGVEEEGLRGRSARIRLKVTPDVATYLVNEKRELIAQIDEANEIFTEIVGEPSFIRPTFEIETLAVKSGNISDPLAEIEKENKKINSERRNRQNTRNNNQNKSEEEDEQTSSNNNSGNNNSNNSAGNNQASDGNDDEKSSKRKRRRGRRGGRNRRNSENRSQDGSTENSQENAQDGSGEDKAETNKADNVEAKNVNDSGDQQSSSNDGESKSKRRRRRRSRSDKNDGNRTDASSENSNDTSKSDSSGEDNAAPTASEDKTSDAKPVKAKRATAKSSKAKKSEKVETADTPTESTDDKPAKKTTAKKAAQKKKAAPKKTATKKAASKTDEASEEPVKAKKAPAKKVPAKTATTKAKTEKAEKKPAKKPAAKKAAAKPTKSKPVKEAKAPVEKAEKPEKSEIEAPKKAAVSKPAAKADDTKKESEKKEPEKKGWWKKRNPFG